MIDIKTAPYAALLLRLTLGLWPRLVALTMVPVLLAVTGDGAWALKLGLPFGKTPAVAAQHL